MVYDPVKYQSYYQRNREKKLAQVKAWNREHRQTGRPPDAKGVRHPGSRRWLQAQRALGILASKRGAHLKTPEFIAVRRAALTKHGGAPRPWKTPEYIAYQGAWSRCNNPKATDYVHYGGRGIEFRYTSFQAFLADVGLRPPRGDGKRSRWSLDRKDTNGHYEPGNCRWTTQIVQIKNRRRLDIPYTPYVENT